MQEDLIKRVMKGSLIIFILSSLGSFLSYVMRSFYSHTLSIEEFGLFYAGLNIVNTLWTYTDLGFGYVITYLMPKYIKSGEYKLAWNIYKYGQIIQIGTSLILSLILVISAGFISNTYFKIPGSEVFVYLLAVYLVSYSFVSSLTQVFMGVQREKYYASMVFLRSMLSLVFSLIFWHFEQNNTIGYLIAWLVGYTLTALVFLYLLHVKYKFLTSNKLYWDKELFNKMVYLAAPSFFTTLVYSLLTSSDVFFLTLFRGVTEVGFYNIIFPLASVSMVILSPITNLILPLFSHLMEGEKQKAVYLVEKLLQIVPFVAIYFALFLVLFPVAPIRLFFGEKWLGLSDKLLGPLALGFVVSAVVYVFGSVIQGMGKVRERLISMSILAILSVILNGILVWYLGVTGAVITNILVSLISFYLFMEIIKKDLSFKIPYTLYLKIFAFSLILFVVTRVSGFYPTAWVQFIFSGLVYSALFFVFGYFIRLYDLNFYKLFLTSKNKS